MPVLGALDRRPDPRAGELQIVLEVDLHPRSTGHVEAGDVMPGGHLGEHGADPLVAKVIAFIRSGSRPLTMAIRRAATGEEA